MKFHKLFMLQKRNKEFLIPTKGFLSSFWELKKKKKLIIKKKI